MKLADYLAAKKTTPEAFAAALHVDRWTVERWIRKERTPTPPMLERIAKASNGAVLPNDFFEFAGLKGKRS